jgi:hypothetical protein
MLSTRLPLFAEIVALLVLTTACSHEDAKPTHTATQTLAEAFLPAPGYTPPSRPTPTPGPPFPHTPVPMPDDWDASAVWQSYLEGSSLYDECVPALEMDCVVRVAVDENVSPREIAFVENYETVLIYFQELGTVDFGAISWPAINMGRPEPVFLNGDFGLLDYGSLIPEDWHEADPSYATLSASEEGDSHPFPWAEYSRLASASSGADGQHAVMETVLKFCRACPAIAYLTLDIAFSPDGAVGDVTVLPMRCESEVFDLELGQGPCNPDGEPS